VILQKKISSGHGARANDRVTQNSALLKIVAGQHNVAQGSCKKGYSFLFFLLIAITHSVNHVIIVRCFLHHNAGANTVILFQS
jgi:hypothetical protein